MSEITRLEMLKGYISSAKDEDELLKSVRDVMRLLTPADGVEISEEDAPKKEKRKYKKRVPDLSRAINKYIESKGEQIAQEMHQAMQDAGIIARTITLDKVLSCMRQDTNVFTERVNGKWALRKIIKRGGNGPTKPPSPPGPPVPPIDA